MSSAPSSSSAPHPDPYGLPNAPMTLTALVAYLESKESEAKEIMPFSSDVCTYGMGPLLQAVWACRDCGGRGICYSCSVRCHTEHDLVELFPRRSFTCECPTSSTPTLTAQISSSSHHQCTLNPPYIQPLPAPPENQGRYGKNFMGEFCRCERGKKYDPFEEKESMVACFACEDWFHESCLGLQPPPTDPPSSKPLGTTSSSSPEETLTPFSLPSSLPPLSHPTADIDEDDDDNDNESPLLPSTSYTHLICSACVMKHKLLQRVAGTVGWGMIVPRVRADGVGVGEWEDGWEILGDADKDLEKAEVDKPQISEEDTKPVLEASSVVGEKRKHQSSPSLDPQDLKKPRIEDIKPTAGSGKAKAGECSLPPASARAQAVFEALRRGDEGQGKGDIFVSEGRREWLGNCGCNECTEEIAKLPFPLEEEKLYEPPLDTDPVESAESALTTVLEALPRSQALEAAYKFNEMKEKLAEFLEPFRTNGRVIEEEDIRGFLAAMRGGE